VIRRLIFRGLAAAVLVALLAVGAVVVHWAWRGGVEAALAAAARTLREPMPTVHAHRGQPSRPLAASATPLHFGPSRPDVGPPPMVVAPDGRRMPLQQLVRATDSLAFIVVRDDSIVYERYATEHGGTGISHYQEVSEALLHTLFGMALDDGRLRSLDEPVARLVPELAGRGFAALTVQQLVALPSRPDFAEGDKPVGLQALMRHTPRLETLLLQLQRGEAADAPVAPRAARTALLSLLLQRALAPETLAAYAQRRLWAPLGMERDGLWSLDREGGMEKAWCCVAGTARDLAKLGRLQLQGGLAGGQRVLSQAWVDAAASAAAGRADAFGWRAASPAGGDRMAVGRDGQFLYVDPVHRTIVVRLGKGLGMLSQAQWAALFAQLSAHAW
jgi:CubicO group peptidase (beta-lactamase class C family)